MNDETLDLLDRHDWSDSIIRLTAYVVSLCRLKRVSLIAGPEPEDLVMEAIEKVYSGERTWNHQAEPDLYRFLLSVVKSILSNKLTAAENKARDSISETEMDNIPADNNAEAELYARQLDAAISHAMRGDPELCLVYKALKDGCSPKEIAEEYAISIDTVRNAKKRLNRLVRNVIKEQLNMESR